MSAATRIGIFLGFLWVLAFQAIVPAAAGEDGRSGLRFKKTADAFWAVGPAWVCATPDETPDHLPDPSPALLSSFPERVWNGRFSPFCRVYRPEAGNATGRKIALYVLFCSLRIP
ncbi:hypothetical protein [Larkinella soli]|uniref:hypothetical protein n=1 Tax=Larkinella soli TaxID=1770527 RepID=UPI000FFB46E7|nr:hypothetical protein [Larkinella soli]